MDVVRAKIASFFWMKVNSGEEESGLLWVSQAGWHCVLCWPELGLYNVLSSSLDLAPTPSSGPRHLESLQSCLSLLSFICRRSSPFYEAALNLSGSILCLLSWSDENSEGFRIECRKSDCPGSPALLTGWHLGDPLFKVTESSCWGETQPGSANDGLGFSRPSLVVLHVPPNKKGSRAHREA